MEARDSIRQFIVGLLEMKGESGDVSDSDSLLTAGKIDSLDVMQTVLFLEQNFDMDFSVRPFNPEDFESIDSMSQMVE